MREVIIWSEGTYTIREIKNLLKSAFEIGEVVAIKRVSKARWRWSALVETREWRSRGEEA